MINCRNAIESETTENIQDIRSILKEELKDENDSQNSKEEDSKILEFQSILERLILRELNARDEEEEKCRSLDMAIRRQQLVRKEAAAAIDKKNGRRVRHTEK
jgi:hypothetical protein